MQKLKLQVNSYTRKSRKYSSYKGKVGKVAPNRIRRHFKTCIPHQKITTDTTEFKYYEKWRISLGYSNRRFTTVQHTTVTMN